MSIMLTTACKQILMRAERRLSFMQLRDGVTGITAGQVELSRCQLATAAKLMEERLLR